MYGKYDGDVELMGTGGGDVVNFSGSSLFTRTLWLSELQTPLQLSKISHSKGSWVQALHPLQFNISTSS